MPCTPICIGVGAGAAGTKFLKCTALFKQNMGSMSAAELLLCAFYVFEMINCPGEEVDGVSPCIR